ncbi:peptidoglycan recognition protein family protein [Sediminicola sp. 1XM1-17]|uniref:peptidoglycan recognition protein family protein n=1 Tax=Sediminicola sp. 1XM1-17 TaxID=3127702 RepID=UPI0030769D7C
MKQAILIIILLTFVSCSVSRVIVDKPVIFNEERISLTNDYMADRYGMEPDSARITPKMIVLHWTAIPTFQGSYDVFYNVKLPSWRDQIQTASNLNVSSHFLVDRDGTIYRLMPETLMARHVIGLNHVALGIENVGGLKGKRLTRAQRRSNIWLVEYLKSKYDIEYLIGHYEYTNFVDHPYWLEKDDAYRTEKTDPGRRFLRRVKKATIDLNFKPTPQKTN